MAVVINTCFRFFWRTALRECTSYLSKSKNITAYRRDIAQPPVRVLGRSQCFALLLSLCLTLSLLYLLAAALSLSPSHSSSRPPTGSSKTSSHTSHLLLLCLHSLIWTSSLIHRATSRVVAQKRPANRLKDPGVPSVPGIRPHLHKSA